MKSLRTNSATARRAGFTLVELMVAAALTILIMTVLASAFQTGMQTLSQLKSVAGLSVQLRTAETIIRADLAGQHLERASGEPVRISSLAGPWVNPNRGYMAIVHGSASSNAVNFVKEGTEDFVDSFRATDHSIFFTTKLSGETAQDVDYSDGTNLAASLLSQNLIDYAVNTNQYVSRWAEIGYVLVPTGKLATVNDDGLPALQLHTLNRRQRGLVPSSVSLPVPANTDPSGLYFTPNPEISVSVKPTTGAIGGAAQAIINDPVTVTDINNRLMVAWGYNAGVANGQKSVVFAAPNTLPASSLAISSPYDKLGSDIVLNNVVSMQIRVMTNTSGLLFLDDLPTNPVPPAVNPRSLDTATPLVSIRAVQIKLRVWDAKNRITRQLTIVQDL